MVPFFSIFNCQLYTSRLQTAHKPKLHISTMHNTRPHTTQLKTAHNTNAQYIPTAQPTVANTPPCPLQGATSIVLCSHLGRPDGQVVAKYSLAPVAEELKKLLNKVAANFSPTFSLFCVLSLLPCPGSLVPARLCGCRGRGRLRCSCPRLRHSPREPQVGSHCLHHCAPGLLSVAADGLRAARLRIEGGLCVTSGRHARRRTIST